MSTDPAHQRPAARPALVWFVRIALIAWLGLVLVRAVEFLLRAAIDFQHPYEVFYLEAKFVQLAWRFQAGLPLYPAWWDYPHVPNFFGPVYSVLVGGIGRLTDATPDGLFQVARGVTIASALAGTLIAAIATRRRWGLAAGVVAGSMMLGSLPTVHFATMARPDALADTLGLAGFLLAIDERPGRWRVAAACLLFVLAALTKQTAVLYPVAACVGLLIERRWQRTLIVAAVTGASVAALVAIVTFTVSPHFASCLLAEGRMPLEPVLGYYLIVRLAYGAPELFALPVLGLFFWVRPPTRDPGLAALALLAPVLMAAAALKTGSDYNYFLPVRTVAAMAAGAWFGFATERLKSADRFSWLLAAITLLMIAPLTQSVLVMHRMLDQGRARAERFASPDGLRAGAAYQALVKLASDPATKLLTDSGLIALHQGARAAFVDPWLFRELVRQGRIRPGRIRNQLRSGGYDVVITSRPIEEKAYDQNIFGLPPPLAAEVRRRYLRVGGGGGPFHVYVLREAAGSSGVPPSP